jgi:hypothetical protein
MWIENRAPSGWFPRLALGEAWASREIALVIELYLDARGERAASVAFPPDPVLAAGDYVPAVAIRSPCQRLLDQEVLTFRLWPPPDERRESVQRNRIVQPAVEWRLEQPVLARTASS